MNAELKAKALALLWQEGTLKGTDKHVEQAALEASFAEVKERIGCDRVAEEEVVLKASGQHLRGECPLPGHEGTSPSFYCLADEQGRYTKWWCHRCGRGGDVFDLFNELFGPYGKPVFVLQELAARYGIKLWRPEELMDDEQLQIRRARQKAERAIERTLTAYYFELKVMPGIRAIKDVGERKRVLERCVKEAGLA